MVYIIECNNKYKVGRTKNIDRRIKQFQTGNAEVINIVRKYFSGKDSKLETTIHNYLKNHKIIGEWFEISNANFIQLDALFQDFKDYN